MTYRTSFLYAVAAALGLTVAAPASADPTVGVGFTITFGGGQPNVGAGLRVFSNDEEDEFAASLGLDYLFTTRNVRPSIGAAYLFDSGYVGVDLGYGLNGGGFDVGVGAGFADTEDDKRRPAPVVAPPGGEGEGGGETPTGEGPLEPV